jgi:glycosyltransferase involved in cell wall biosynthesis
MKRFFREHPEYRIIHSHIDTMSFLPLLAGKMAGVPVRIAHSHGTSLDRDAKYPLKQLFRLGLGSVATHYFSCGQAAGEFLFGEKDFRVIANAIDAQRFFYDPMVRQNKRAELSLDGKLVVGHVGRFCYPKNHGFLIDIFARVAEKESSAMLLLVGTGEKEAEIRQKTQELGLQDRVMFLGSRGDVNELYQVMDVFLMPSLFEGVPMVGVESQFAGVPCLFSNKVPQEVMFTERCEFVPLESTAEQWADRVLYWALQQRSGVQLTDSPYDIRYAGRILEQYYLDLNNGLENK